MGILVGCTCKKLSKQSWGPIQASIANLLHSYYSIISCFSLSVSEDLSVELSHIGYHFQELAYEPEQRIHSTNCFDFGYLNIASYQISEASGQASQIEFLYVAKGNLCSCDTIPMSNPFYCPNEQNIMWETCRSSTQIPNEALAAWQD